MPPRGRRAARAQERANAAIRASRRHAYAPLRRWRDLVAQLHEERSLCRARRPRRTGARRKIDRDLYYDAAVFNKLVEAVRAHIEAKGPSLATDLKDAMGVSRKYAIPVLEALDDRGITKRDGDLRTL